MAPKMTTLSPNGLHESQKKHLKRSIAVPKKNSWYLYESYFKNSKYQTEDFKKSYCSTLRLEKKSNLQDLVKIQIRTRPNRDFMNRYGGSMSYRASTERSRFTARTCLICYGFEIFLYVQRCLTIFKIWHGKQLQEDIPQISNPRTINSEDSFRDRLSI